MSVDKNLISKIDQIILENEKKKEKETEVINLDNLTNTNNLLEKNILKDKNSLLEKNNDITLYCEGCKKDKTPEEFGIKKDGKGYYKKCIECREKPAKSKLALPKKEVEAKKEIEVTKTLPNIVQQQEIAAKMVKELNNIEKKDIERMKEIILKHDKTVSKDTLDIMTDEQVIAKRDAIATEQISIALSSGPEDILFMGIKMIAGVIECLPQLKEKEIYLDGWSESIERNKTVNIALIKKICEKSPAMLSKLTPEIQLGVSIIGSGISVATQNKLKRLTEQKK